MHIKNISLYCCFILSLITMSVHAGSGADEELYELDYDSCRKSAIGAIEENVRKSKIHKWIDENGQTHFGAEPPTSTKSEEIVKRTSDLSYFELNFGSQSRVPRYEFELTNSIRNVYKIFVSIVGQKHFKKTRVNLSIFDDESGYKSFYAQHVKRSSVGELGFHIGSTNIVGVRAKNERQAIATSIHEATHVITRGNFGRLPKWLNEGIAEYMETVESQFQSVHINPETSWLGYIKSEHISVNELMASAKESWQGERYKKMVAYSWALVYFLLSTNESKDLMSNYLRLSAGQPCDIQLNSRDFFNNNYPKGLSQMQRDFEIWLDTNSFGTHYY